MDCRQVYDYLNTELIHNQTFTFRLSPTLVEQARGYADYHENTVFWERTSVASETVRLLMRGLLMYN